MTTTNGTRLVFDGQPLIEWRRTDSNWPADKMVYAKATESQVIFVGDTLPKAYCGSLDDYRYANDGAGVTVIGGHTSKSCYLPVYGLDIPHLGVRAVLSNNFHHWVVSMELPRAVDLSMFTDLMSKEAVNPIYCSGFAEHWVHPAPAKSPRLWTIEMWSQYDVYALFMVVSHQLRTAQNAGK